ncbi:hypothetical protein [Microbacterium oleivorans]|uniref:hypothetical protein n=1 Tax=Microbacterium oleivorans TaxID=273677 RepID=UPI00080DA7FA|nr:hypothetical protein [Microbacterium oleivorans]
MSTGDSFERLGAVDLARRVRNGHLQAWLSLLTVPLAFAGIFVFFEVARRASLSSAPTVVRSWWGTLDFATALVLLLPVLLLIGVRVHDGEVYYLRSRKRPIAHAPWVDVAAPTAYALIVIAWGELLLRPTFDERATSAEYVALLPWDSDPASLISAVPVVMATYYVVGGTLLALHVAGLTLNPADLGTHRASLAKALPGRRRTRRR